MKKIFVCMFVWMFAFGSISSGAVDVSDNASFLKQKVEVYYFHFTRRCITCKAVETQTKSALEEFYADQIKNGLVEFFEVNLDDKNSKKAVAKAKAEGQGLIFMKGESRVDLTTQAFMYAVSNPEKLKQEIKKVVDSMLNIQ